MFQKKIKWNEYVAVIDADSIIHTFCHINKNNTNWDNIKFGLDRYINNILDACNTDKYVLCIEGKGNFRHQLKSFSTVYKGSRKSEKPVWFNEIRQHMIDYWKAELAIGIETDDLVTILVTNMSDDENYVNCILCHLDKDLDQITKNILHYNYRQKTFKKISRKKALLYLWKSVLTGDSTDCIKGVPGVGEKTVAKIFDGKDIDKEIPGLVFQEYWNYWVNSKGYSKNKAVIEFISNFQMLYMLEFLSNINDNLPKINNRTELT